LTTSPDRFHSIRLEHCRSTNDYVRENLARLGAEMPLMVSTGVQSSGRGRGNRGWFSAPGLGLYVTFAFRLADARRLSLLSLVSGVAVCDMLAAWTGREFVLKWPNDVLGEGKKVAGILCESMISGEAATCLAGIGVNLNHLAADFPAELRMRASSLRMLTGREWPVAAARERLAVAMVSWLRRLTAGDAGAVLERARELSCSFLGREIGFHRQGVACRGVFRGLADDGGLRLQTDGGEETVFYGDEISG
jgi:BirA family biotin operon repressor/biotin-[acetyl-CoA-carboxylase] ligase